MNAHTQSASRPIHGWEHFPHQADVGIRGFAPTLAGVFEQAACAITAVVTDLNRVRPRRRVRIVCSGHDHDLLLYDWLNTLIFEMATRHMLFSRFEVSISDQQLLHASVYGEAVDVERHQPRVEIKGATFTELCVYEDDDNRWYAQCILDV